MQIEKQNETQRIKKSCSKKRHNLGHDKNWAKNKGTKTEADFIHFKN